MLLTHFFVHEKISRIFLDYWTYTMRMHPSLSHFWTRKRVTTMRKMMIALVSVLMLSTSAFGQIKIEGEKNATVGYMLKLKLSQLAVDDPQIKCFPDNPDWLATKDFAGQAWIIYVPGKKTLTAGETSKLITFVVAGNKGGKTFLETFEVTVAPDGDVPVPTPDEVTKTPLYKTLQAAYLVSPNADAKGKLITVYQAFHDQIKANKFKNNGEAVDELKRVTPMFVGTELKAVRDAVADYFVATVGTSRSAWDKEKLQRAVATVINAMKKIPD